MANERVTENFVRNHFNKFPGINIEEQRSENLKIKKLLQNASKKGNKHGLPEFIISYTDNSDLLIVIECKGSITKHESESHDNYSEFAVDGVLLYSSFLSKEYDVLSIAVSGQNLKELKISHFLHLKGDTKASPIFHNKLLSPDNYLQEYKSSPQKYRQDFASLLSFSKTLNETLHSKKVKESQRSLLISGILIALENKAFNKSYKDHVEPDNLANSLAETIINQLKIAKLSTKKLDNLKNAYNFIRTHTSLAGEKGVLSKLIEDIDTNINNFRKTHKFVDFLGQFYIEFLKYANSDKGLGIVLTPPHITELFAELANVNKDSVVLDNCTGTGGFLISAMSKMIKDAKGDLEKIKEIKEKQLIGIEWQDDIFALACSNMYIHQDGKTNIIHGSCFDPAVKDLLNDKKLTAGFLNPPYPKVATDPLELEFVLNNLDFLQPNSVCIAIVPMSCVLAIKGREYELKKQILKDHTLEATLSMPDQLFYNTGVGVVTSILVITAHKPHPIGKKTWFGYFKDDGYKVQKHKGRNDSLNKWKDVKDKWLNAYINKEVIDQLSVIKEVSASDEWCAEAYMTTDYTLLSENIFVNEMKRYAAFQIITSQE